MVETERKRKNEGKEKRRERTILGVTRSAPVTFFRGTRVEETEVGRGEGKFLNSRPSHPARGGVEEQRSGRTKPEENVGNAQRVCSDADLIRRPAG